jgi:hypothetical protein
MNELEDRISSLLNDPDQMGKIAQMAKSLMDNGGGETLAQAIGGALGGEKRAESGLSSGSGLDSGLDAGMLASLGKLMGGAASGGSDKRQLLEAMMPYFSEKRREKLKKALRVAQMAKIAGVVFSEYGGEKKDGV